MLLRLLNLPQNNSFFLFGARGTGKSTLTKKTFHKRAFYINLLLASEEDRYARNPDTLAAEVIALPPHITHIIIDEVQKIPKLLDIVHNLIESTDKRFILTGSSARRLKMTGVNLLAGRAFVYHLYPFSFIELGEKFSLEKALRWGMLPKIAFFSTDEEKLQFLLAYSQTYLKEEIWAEHFIKNLDPFRRFLEVSAQCNGKIINYAKVARDVGVDDKTVKEYFSLLEDTLIGFYLETFQHSFRKRLSQKPKFYYFDTGVSRALSRQLTVPLKPKTSVYGEAFEHFIITECIKLASYYKPEYRFSYLKTKDDNEIDLVVERPGLPLLFIEIKSNDNISIEDLSAFIKIVSDFKPEPCEAICFSNDPHAKQYGQVSVFPWQEGIKKYFLFSPDFADFERKKLE
jgi:predicted AAA+ superfamily ATPase